MMELQPGHPPYKDLYIYYLKGRVPQGVLTEAPAFIGNWEEEEDSFLFFGKPSASQVLKVVEQHPHLTLSDEFEMTYEQWQGGRLAPVRIGRLQVLPAWHADTENAHDGGDGRILLDPGVVFGAGTHPTTRDCLAAVQRAFDMQPIGDVLDLGTGTGLLALAAVRCGASRCVAVDLNHLAVRTAAHNVQINRMTDRIVVVQGDAKNFMDLTCDLVISNIHYDIMRHIIDAPGFRATEQFVLSGLLRSQAREIEHRLLENGAKILKKWDCDGIWYTFHGVNAQPSPNGS